MKKKINYIVCMLLVVSLFVMAQAVPALAKDPVLGTSLINQCLFKSPSVEFDGKIYYVYGNGVYCIKKDGTDKKSVCVIKERRNFSLAYFTVAGDYIYALMMYNFDAPYGRLIRINPDGTGYKLYKGEKFNNYESLCAVNGKLYYEKQEKDHRYIYSMNQDGSGRKILMKDAHFCCTDGKNIYYKPQMGYDRNTIDKIYYCNMKGKNSVELVASKDYIYDFQVTDNYCYYSVSGNSKTYTVYKKNMKTCSVKKVYSGKYIESMHADGKNLYLIDSKHKLVKINTSTGKSEVVKTKLAGIWGVFDDVMVVDTLLKQDGWSHIILMDRLTGKKFALLGKWKVSTSAG